MATYGASAVPEPTEGCKQFGSLQPLNLNIVLPINPFKGSEERGICLTKDGNSCYWGRVI